MSEFPGNLHYVPPVLDKRPGQEGALVFLQEFFGVRPVPDRGAFVAPDGREIIGKQFEEQHAAPRVHPVMGVVDDKTVAPEQVADRASDSA